MRSVFNSENTDSHFEKKTYLWWEKRQEFWAASNIHIQSSLILQATAIIKELPSNSKSFWLLKSLQFSMTFFSSSSLHVFLKHVILCVEFFPFVNSEQVVISWGFLIDTSSSQLMIIIYVEETANLLYVKKVGCGFWVSNCHSPFAH